MLQFSLFKSSCISGTWVPPCCPPLSTSTFPCADVSLSNELGRRLVPCFQALHTPTAFHSRALTQAQTLPECHFRLIKPFSHRPLLSPRISRPCFSLQSLHELSDEGKTYGGNDNISTSGEFLYNAEVALLNLCFQADIYKERAFECALGHKATFLIHIENIF